MVKAIEENARNQTIYRMFATILKTVSSRGIIIENISFTWHTFKKQRKQKSYDIGTFMLGLKDGGAFNYLNIP